MKVAHKFLPGTGRWQCVALTEGVLRLALHVLIAPSTMLRMVPLPLQERIGL